MLFFFSFIAANIANTFPQLVLNMQDYTAKLSDFGLAKAGPQGDETHVSTRVMGTYGYAAPEYVMTGMTCITIARCFPLKHGL